MKALTKAININGNEAEHDRIPLFTSKLLLWYISNDKEYNQIMQQLAATLHGSRPGVQSASLIMTSLMTS